MLGWNEFVLCRGQKKHRRGDFWNLCHVVPVNPKDDRLYKFNEEALEGGADAGGEHFLEKDPDHVADASECVFDDNACHVLLRARLTAQVNRNCSTERSAHDEDRVRPSDDDCGAESRQCIELEPFFRRDTVGLSVTAIVHHENVGCPMLPALPWKCTRRRLAGGLARTMYASRLRPSDVGIDTDSKDLSSWGSSTA